MASSELQHFTNFVLAPEEARLKSEADLALIPASLVAGTAVGFRAYDSLRDPNMDRRAMLALVIGTGTFLATVFMGTMILGLQHSESFNSIPSLLSTQRELIYATKDTFSLTKK